MMSFNSSGKVLQPFRIEVGDFVMVSLVTPYLKGCIAEFSRMCWMLVPGRKKMERRREGEWESVNQSYGTTMPSFV
jgi:hypothetical protein